MDVSWLSMLPPIIVIILMLFTQRLNFSLIVAIITAALIATQGNTGSMLFLITEKIIEHFSNADMILLYVFLVIISSLIILLTSTGSASACARIIGKRIKTARGGEIASVLLAFLMSLDDYLSILTVGFVMRPIADTIFLARTKLAYIVHALAGPLVIIVPISTWAAAILSQLEVAGVDNNHNSKIYADAFYVYIKTIPFVFYSIFTVMAVWLVVLTRMKMGQIGRQEELLQQQNSATISFSEDADTQQHSILELLMPLLILIGGVFFGILYAGDYYVFGGMHSFIEAFKQNDKTFLVLLLSALAAFLFNMTYYLFKRMIKISQLPKVIYDGFMLIKSSIIMVILASILGSFLRSDLQTGNYLAQSLLGTTPLFLLPVLFFLVSLIVTLMTGSAWGSFALLIPIAIQMLIAFLGLKVPVRLEEIPLLFPVLGAILSGAACGNHLSPFAETTIMTATSTGVEPMDHARSQFPYAIPIIIGSIVAFLCAGLLAHTVSLIWSFTIAFAIGGAISFILLYIMHRLKL